MVLVVGTNNIKGEGNEQIFKKFEKLVKETKQHKYRKVSIMGILKRKDLRGNAESRRIGVNLRLRKLCEENDIGYVYKELVSDEICKDRAHLSNIGQDEVARIIFKHC